ncbi:hypothetical protein [Enterococcus malodoratus]|uniref:Uncharacterized protein n=1 Tax=Enterococcus malodoratus ATCC 43197 TaxID=1158601 RepID=R2P8F7_9ENTE|nr:hypothetical protein [Enterococcus malodoratus]EOH80587.1 hypothetical protein UAI_00625 [Enterococcus malodoratus ATCC 43197]EOT69096.1 hypothetical protein I585_00556 [Enterococcus malodoratus ATCC 43197]OJG63948.1 hypothetical protein RV07_GL000588 [Enterococcus malodoratus]SET50270.1 hypothetical protein SAMN04487821_113122 [Enterococcus malodoratus]SPW67470.1 Uncharacterised protein [Enterococcus malodoratus]
MKNYRIGFSPIGLLTVCLVMLPNLLFLFITPPNNVLSQNESSFWLWNLLENVGRFGMMGSLCFILNRTPARKNSVLTMSALGSLILYFVLWGFYFAGISNGLMLVGLAVFPSIFFLLTAWKLRNPFALSFVALFALTHITITASNFLF